MTYPPAKGEPILILCEGGRALPNAPRDLHGGVSVGFCRMCGVECALNNDGLVPSHERDDVLARIERGDFG